MQKEKCSVCKNMMGNSLSKNNKGQPTHTKCKTNPMQNNPFDLGTPEVKGYKTTNASPMQKEEWGEEFDGMFLIPKDYFKIKKVRDGEMWTFDNPAKEIKSFIQKLLQEKGDEIIKELDGFALSEKPLIDEIIKRIMEIR